VRRFSISSRGASSGNREFSICGANHQNCHRERIRSPRHAPLLRGLGWRSEGSAVCPARTGRRRRSCSTVRAMIRCGSSTSVPTLGKCAVVLAASIFCTGRPVAVAQVQSAPVKLCVAVVSSHSTRPLNTQLQQDRLVSEFHKAKKDKKGKLPTVEAIPLHGEDPARAGSEARDKGCAYVLYTNVVQLHGGYESDPIRSAGAVMINDPDARAGTPVYNDKMTFWTKIEFQLYPLGEPKPILSSSALGHQMGPAEESVASVWNVVARQTRAALAGR